MLLNYFGARMLDALKIQVWEANKALVDAGLVICTWGNASGIDRGTGLVVIKPSGVGYECMRPEDMVVVSLDSGDLVEGYLRPSSDTPTHLCLYRAFLDLGGIVHTHSLAATSWAQAGRELPCFGTTHADHFFGAVPVTRQLTDEEIACKYEYNTGMVIVERFRNGTLQPLQVPAVLVPGHGPFTWGRTAADAVQNAVVLEAVATMGLNSLALQSSLTPISKTLLDKHFLRKHGPGAYYGQAESAH